MIERHGYGPQVDVWMVGCMMYEMLTGLQAFPSFDQADWVEHKDLFRRICAVKYDRYVDPVIV
jgi:serine/threonine protein kinase